MQERRQSQSRFRPCFSVGLHLRLPYQLLLPVTQFITVLWCHIQYLFPGLLSVQGQVNQITPRRIAAVQGCPDPPLYFIRTPYNGVLARPGMITAPSRP